MNGEQPWKSRDSEETAGTARMAKHKPFSEEKS
jgi:hypothetical protein